MTNLNFPISSDEDLPRTFRRARQEQAAAQASSAPFADPPSSYPAGAYDDTPPDVVVRAVKVPFFRLMFFFIKAVFAAIPALIILGVLLWLGGEILTNMFPQLVKMKILIQFPN